VLVETLELFFMILTAMVLAYLVRHYVFTLAVIKNAHRQKGVDTSGGVRYQPTVSVLIPARNEGNVIGTILHRMTELTYPKDKLQVIVIDDGSRDDTGKVAEQHAKAFNYIDVLKRDQNHGGQGKSAALNAGVKLAKNDIILCFDADYYPQRDIIDKLVAKFSDPKVGAVQARITVLNEPINMVTRLVALERTGGYRVDQQAREELGLIPQFGGTAGAVRRSLLEQLGGWDESILAEDTDLTFRVCLAGYKVRYVNDAECYEEAVESWRAYWKQRHRWAAGHMQCFFKHWLRVLRSNNLGFKEKIDGLLLLGVYFMPVLALLSWIVGISLFFLKPLDWFRMLWALMPVSFYSCVGNFAPFFEVGIGVYLDGRTRAQWLVPLLVFTFLYNIPICSKAFADLISSKLLGARLDSWNKTAHSGNGNSYIMN
jgi:cellulose synthase/poly-beta-1,6-N-acetylglucosamine synthase-like glycosyltransferase